LKWDELQWGEGIVLHVWGDNWRSRNFDRINMWSFNSEHFITLEENWGKKTIIYNYILVTHRTFVIQNYLVALNKLHKTLVASVNEGF
jgi:hypothetical protein